MAQVVIFAPPGEDVSAGESALKDAGHKVEVVEATAANLLHMAIGMIDGGDEAEPEAEAEPATEPVEEDPLADEVPEEPAEEPTTESIGDVVVDGETVTAYLDRSLPFPLIRVLDLTGDAKLTYKINESSFSFWKDAGARADIGGFATKVAVGRARTKPYVILDEVTAKRLKLV
jgi:hypothetical protein